MLKVRWLVIASCVTLIASCVGGSSESGGGDGGGGGGSTCQSYTTTAACASAWAEQNPHGTDPEVRYAASVAYDSLNDRFIVFGGTDDTEYYTNTFVLSNASGGATPSWEQLVPTGNLPSDPAFSASAYDSVGNNLIVFGGSDDSSIDMNLWLLSNANGTGGTPAWTNPPITGAAPSSRASMAYAYDDAGDTLFLFGGRACTTSSCTLYNDIYLIHDVTTNPTWEQLSPTGTAPAKRAFASAVYDSEENRLIVFGGTTSTSRTSVYSASRNDTWILSNADGTGGTPAWTNPTPSAESTKLYGHSAVYDSVNDRMIVFGGVSDSNLAQNAVWILKDSRSSSLSWSQYITCNPVPDARRFHGVAYTGSDLNKMILFGGELPGDGGSLNDVWILSGANGMPSSDVASVTVATETTELCDDYVMQLVPVVYDVYGIEIEDFLYTCISSDESVATVDEECLVTAVGEGTVTITIIVDDITTTVTLTIVSSGGGGGGDEDEENWTGTFELIDVFDGVYVCTYTTTGSIAMAMTNTDGRLSGTGTFSNLQETSVSELEDLACPPSVHSTETEIVGEVDSNGDYSFTFFVLDYAGITPFTATISGDSFSASGTKQSSMNTYTYTINATRR